MAMNTPTTINGYPVIRFQMTRDGGVVMCDRGATLRFDRYVVWSLDSSCASVSGFYHDNERVLSCEFAGRVLRQGGSGIARQQTKGVSRSVSK